MESNIKAEIEKAYEVLTNNGVILYPTDTIWGLGCLANDEVAIQKIKDIKKRIEGKSFVTLLDDDRKLNRYVRDIPEVAWDLIEYTETPLTIIYPEGINMSKKVMAEDGSVAIRITKDEFCKSLIRKIKTPLVSTSANISGQTSPKNFKDIDPSILEQVDYVVNLRQNEAPASKASTIMKLETDGTFQFIRK